MKIIHNYGLLYGAQNEKWEMDFCVRPSFKKSMLFEYWSNWYLLFRS